jgi:hypothetical protein
MSGGQTVKKRETEDGKLKPRRPDEIGDIMGMSTGNMSVFGTQSKKEDSSRFPDLGESLKTQKSGLPSSQLRKNKFQVSFQNEDIN